MQPFKAEASQVIQSTATPDHAPPVLLQLAELLPAPTRPIEVVGGPSYVFESVSPEASLCSAELVVFTSEGDVSSTLATARPQAWWKADEWADLLAGHLGPWAIGIAAGLVANLCHTAVASVRAAEAGVWTHPDVRGRGYASIVTRAWATVASTEFQNLFYSTSASNTASRRVAEKMQLRPIGWIWQLRTATNATA